jgi:hypothetical protein
MPKSLSQKKSRLQERRAAEDLGGYVQKASGATDFAKGDVRKPGDVRVECKTTSARSFSLKLDELIKIQGEALRGGAESAVMQVEFQGAQGLNKKYAVLPWAEFLALRESALGEGE